MRTILTAVPVLLMMASVATAQTPGADRAAQPQPSERCLRDLQAFRAGMRADGLWLSGFRATYGWPATSRASRHDQTAARTAPGTGDIGERSSPAAFSRAAEVQAQGGGAIGAAPWTRLDWRMPPMQELRALHAATIVLAQRGAQQACETVLGELRAAYAQYGERLRAAGYDGASAGSYRQERIAAARPVAELRRALGADTITGADLRSPRDVYLGSVEDLLLDPSGERITHAVVARGGFLGIGENYVAVPWRRLRATSALDLFVIDATEAAMDGAPTLDPDALADAEGTARQRRAIDDYWQRQQGG